MPLMGLHWEGEACYDDLGARKPANDLVQKVFTFRSRVIDRTACYRKLCGTAIRRQFLFAWVDCSFRNVPGGAFLLALWMMRDLMR